MKFSPTPKSSTINSSVPQFLKPPNPQILNSSVPQILNNQLLLFMKNRRLATGLLFFAIAFVTHWPARDAGFLSDFVGWQDLYDRYGWGGVWNSFGYGGHQQVLQFLNYTLYAVFGTWGLPWHFVFCLAHAANAWLLYRLMLRLTEAWGASEGRFIALFGALFFLCSPYNPEVTVWRVCLHYLLSGLFSLGALWLTLDFIQKGNTRALWWAHGLMLVNLFTLELALAIPLLTHALYVAAQFAKRDGGLFADWKRALWHMTLPQAGLYGFFFVFNKLTIGQWVGHYGEERMLDFNVLQMLANPLRYILKHLLLARHWDHTFKMRLFEGMESWPVVLSGYGLIIGLALLAILGYRRISRRFSLLVLLLILAIMAALPVSNLFFDMLLLNENDRYGYLPSLFIMPALAILLSWLPRFWPLRTASVFLGFSIFLLIQTNFYWREMDRIYRKLLDEYAWQDKKEVIILSLADNLQGIWMYRFYKPESAMADALTTVKRQKPQGLIREVALFNMFSGKEKINASWIEKPNKIKVEMEQWGPWWWIRGLGAQNYENERFKVEFKGRGYELTFKNGVGDALLIYQSADSWKVLE